MGSLSEDVKELMVQMYMQGCSEGLKKGVSCTIEVIRSLLENSDSGVITKEDFEKIRIGALNAVDGFNPDPAMTSNEEEER